MKKTQVTEQPQAETAGGADRRRILQILAGLGAAAAAPVAAQDAAKVSPRTYKVVFENDKIRVLEYVSKPGLGICGQGRHYHPAHVTMQLSDAKVRLTLEDGTVLLKEAPAGAIFASPAEWHTTENVGGAHAHAYIVEFKDTAWRPSTG
ncbi:MAG: cytoplasmic protein [Pseudomonadota bacterium]